MRIDAACPHTKHRLGDIGYIMFVILEPIANGTHIYPYLHICNLSNLPVKYHSISYHDVYMLSTMYCHPTRGWNSFCTFSRLWKNEYVLDKKSIGNWNLVDTSLLISTFQVLRWFWKWVQNMTILLSRSVLKFQNDWSTDKQELQEFWHIDFGLTHWGRVTHMCVC